MCEDVGDIMVEDFDEELRKAKRMILSAILFLVAGIFSYVEIKYWIWGRMAEAKVVRTFDTAEGGGLRRSPKLAVEYSFTDEASGPRNERDDVPISWKVTGPTEMVEYLPGVADSSRLKGNDRSLAVYLFAGACLWLAYEGYKLWSMAHAAVHGKRRRR